MIVGMGRWKGMEMEVTRTARLDTSTRRRCGFIERQLPSVQASEVGCLTQHSSTKDTRYQY